MLVEFGPRLTSRDNFWTTAGQLFGNLCCGQNFGARWGQPLGTRGEQLFGNCSGNFMIPSLTGLSGNADTSVLVALCAATPPSRMGEGVWSAPPPCPWPGGGGQTCTPECAPRVRVPRVHATSARLAMAEPLEGRRTAERMKRLLRESCPPHVPES